MTATAAPAGLALTTSLQKLVGNPAGSKEIRTYEISFVNSDGVNSADITQCLWIDASANNAANPIMPTNTRVSPGGDGARFRRFTLEPGDEIQVAASAAGDIHAVAQQVYAEPAP